MLCAGKIHWILLKKRENNMNFANAPDYCIRMTLKEDSRLRFLLNGVFRRGGSGGDSGRIQYSSDHRRSIGYS